MISNEGASLLAQVLPVGVVLVVLESRFLAAIPRKKIFLGVYNTPSRTFFSWVAALNVVATAICIYAVSSGVTLDGWPANLVFIAASMLLGSAVPLVLVIGGLPGVAPPPPSHRADSDS